MIELAAEVRLVRTRIPQSTGRRGGIVDPACRQVSAPLAGDVVVEVLELRERDPSGPEAVTGPSGMPYRWSSIPSGHPAG
ncbi:hypothetical protein [Microbacterium sp. gxy059]|uniref:hypothetical protein n=1 Tax=Microbacterium sp. gxy059 TaxID=2957199 RepID=UPI003D9886AF